MSKKWKILGYQTNIEWYDIKTKFKQLLRKLAYSWLFQEIICAIFSAYMWLVFLTSKKTFIGEEILIKAAKAKKPVIITFWHNRLMMTPFITMRATKASPGYRFMTLASRHGDGKFVGRVMEKFGFISILGSTKDGRKASRGISFSSIKQIISGLKKGQSLGITPDGPRGPNQKINGELINIARLSGAEILPISYSSSKFKQLNTWDKFKIPLPFGKICFYFDKESIKIDKETSDEEMEKLKLEVEKKLNSIQQKADIKLNS